MTVSPADGGDAAAATAMDKTTVKKRRVAVRDLRGRMADMTDSSQVGGMGHKGFDKRLNIQAYGLKAGPVSRRDECG
jgi:hypothetical protein